MKNAFLAAAVMSILPVLAGAYGGSYRKHSGNAGYNANQDRSANGPTQGATTGGAYKPITGNGQAITGVGSNPGGLGKANAGEGGGGGGGGGGGSGASGGGGGGGPAAEGSNNNNSSGPTQVNPNLKNSAFNNGVLLQGNGISPSSPYYQAKNLPDPAPDQNAATKVAQPYSATNVLNTSYSSSLSKTSTLNTSTLNSGTINNINSGSLRTGTIGH